ncbi:hypothetical protein QO058_17595 [Bosea vestrisii]|uniref:hypothetical protein n=1 Tax=Bosea vestrisii TaxID=151416 RepID=UPI0024DF791A|nr:hypothetical protein [Bosea vestrisii]WID94643.1 hypothetical protein QO058_17595 [Bosea vestrisii]
MAMFPASAALILGALVFYPASAAFAQTEPAPPSQITGAWPQVKCERWRSAYDEALKRFGRKGLGQEFIAGNEAFISSGCQSPPDVCPRSAEELNFANVMVMAGMNAGLASTFMPYACRKS